MIAINQFSADFLAMAAEWVTAPEDYDRIAEWYGEDYPDE